MFHSRELEVDLLVYEGKFFSARGRFYGLVREQKFLFLLTLQRYEKTRTHANIFRENMSKNKYVFLQLTVSSVDSFFS